MLALSLKGTQNEDVSGSVHCLIETLNRTLNSSFSLDFWSDVLEVNAGD